MCPRAMEVIVNMFTNLLQLLNLLEIMQQVLHSWFLTYLSEMTIFCITDATVSYWNGYTENRYLSVDHQPCLHSFVRLVQDAALKCSAWDYRPLLCDTFLVLKANLKLLLSRDVQHSRDDCRRSTASCLTARAVLNS